MASRCGEFDTRDYGKGEMQFMAEPAAVLTDFVKRFRPEAADGLKAVYQLELTGDDGSLWHLAIANGACQLESGPAEAPDVAITVSQDDWDALTAGRLDAFSAFLSGRLRVEGDLALATRLQTLFGL
jgi:putative sterol carrier protein